MENEPKEIQGEIVDERSGEIIPKGANNKIVTSNLQVQVNVNTIGTLELSEQAEKVLAEPLKPEDVKIRPDGLVYLPWSYYAKKLDQAFGKLQWGMIPQGSPQAKDTGNNMVLIVWTMWLVVKGIPISVAAGETSYRSNNSTMSYGDAIEGAKSSALARNCKQLGISLELWDAEWVDEWKKKYAHKIQNPNGSSQIWVRKDDKRYSVPSPFKTKPASKPVAKPTPQSIASAMEHIRTGEEVPPTEDSLPVDEQFPKDGMAAEAKKLAGGEKLSADNLRKSPNVKAIKEGLANENVTVEIPVIINAINDLGNGHSIEDVVAKIVADTKKEEV